MKLTKKQTMEVIEQLLELYPDASPELDFRTPYELLIAVILSAQCTDVRVNMVTKVLFEKANTPALMCQLEIEELERIIKPCGLYKNKSKNIWATSEMIMNDFNGAVPESIELLMTLPGVGKKTANVVVSNAFGIPAIAVDTHVFRVSNRIGIVSAKTVEDTENQLMKKIDRALWTKSHHLLIFHGRRVCKARKPLCEACPLTSNCVYYKRSVL
ncbi:endonuclease III [Fusibacter ferrireducens]|uniref:Endonuclease III n=1 Tax=Fusibacter ferrireducens TaxID=2785058 RepID=A0ABR9ZVV6_9FIRM|nr:endonuclease III [Fusibacter ferrireducens]MBF4694035.1 endonuclease III [Fusibacter ferrireducens]